MSLRSEAALQSAVRVGIGLFLVSPFLIWLGATSEWAWIGFEELVRPLRASLEQALASTVLACVIGAVLARAHLGWETSRVARLSEAALVFPNLIPPLFIAMSLLSWASALGEFPYGTAAVVVAHTLLNSGLVAISMARLLENRMSGLAEAAWVMGAPPRKFWAGVALPLIKWELAYLALFVFSLHFTSFSLPLLLSGERTVTMEVAIFDAIRLDGRWDKAVIFAIVQSLFLFAWALLLPRPGWPRRAARSRAPYLAAAKLRVWVFAPATILACGWIFGFLRAMGHAWDPEWTAVALEGALTSVALGLAVGVFQLFLFLLIAFAGPHAPMDRLLSGYLAPSPAITGFGLLLLPVESEPGRLALCVLALSLISLPLLYRWMVRAELAALERQITVARTLGGTALAILFDVIWPQVAGSVLRASGLAALWATGDFAISRILLGTDLTLPLVMESLLNNYRYEAAEFLMVPLVAVGVLVYGVFVGAHRYVTR